MLSFLMSDAQVIFRVDKNMLKSLDDSLHTIGFKTRNEWFRAEVRSFLDSVERKKALRRLDRVTVEGMSDEEAAKVAMEWKNI